MDSIVNFSRENSNVYPLHSSPDVLLGAKIKKSCFEKIHEKEIDIFVTFLGEIFFTKKFQIPILD